MEAGAKHDLSRLAEELGAVRRRLSAQARPVRAKLEALGPAGLFALAADEHRKADASEDVDERRVHLGAARAAEALADGMLAGRAQR
jgi:hypothetical protein